MLEPLKRAVKTVMVRRLLDAEKRKRAHLPSGFDGLGPGLWYDFEQRKSVGRVARLRGGEQAPDSMPANGGVIQ